MPAGRRSARQGTARLLIKIMNGPRRIPRIMHQVYLTGKIPEQLQRNVDAHKARNPGWEHRLYDEDVAIDLILKHYGDDMLSNYMRISDEYPAARVDLLCNLIIHAYGGVYFDIKSVFNRPLDEVVRPDDSYLLAQWRNGPGEPNEGFGIHSDLKHIAGGEYMKYFIIAEPKHPYSAAIIKKILYNIAHYRPWSAVGRTGVLRTTGPIAYTLGIHPIRDQHPYRFVPETELGCSPSLSDGYNHLVSFPKKHYSLLASPVVNLSPIGTALSSRFVQLRTLKNRLRKS